MQEENSPQTNGVDQEQTTRITTQTESESSDKSKLPRHPRWTIQDTFILIQGKQVAESRGSKGQAMGSVFGSIHEPKWDFVSSFCRQHGVERGPVQCRKRWGNLVCDFRKVKTWELRKREEGETYWTLRNDSRKEHKLPAFFDKEIYDLLDGEAMVATPYPLRTVKEDPEDGDGEDERESIFGDKAIILKENGCTLEFIESADEEAGDGSSTRETTPTHVPIPDTKEEKHRNKGSCRGPSSQEGRKRKRTSSDGCENTSLEKMLTKVIDKSFTLMNAQIENQNMNAKLEREQKRDQNRKLIEVLTKVADALGRIADKIDSSV